MLELYQDTLVDLLIPTHAKRSKLDIKKDSKGMVTVKNATVIPISTYEDLKNVIQGEETYNSLTYASRVRLIFNDPSKNVSSKEVSKLKNILAYWKEQAGKRGDDEELVKYKGRVIMETRGRNKSIMKPTPPARDPRNVETIERIQQRIQKLELQQLQPNSPAEEVETEPNVWDDEPVDVNPFGGKNIGKVHPDDFIDWLSKVELVFDVRDIPDKLNVKLVAIKL
uniref:Kinesin-like protein KIN-14E n=1 Tax=Tanacetum cinerariifolium TaxID=118510 RepID=A0A6L2KF83_TANCI|nr:kinesin-like protein KIN-14E [Tanacetum cinerariifolium]